MGESHTMVDASMLSSKSRPGPGDAHKRAVACSIGGNDHLFI